MHDDVRAVVQDAAERIEPPPPNVADVESRRRRTLLRSAAGTAVVLLLVAAGLRSVSGLDIGRVAPASTRERRFVVVTHADERRARDDTYTYRNGRWSHHSEPPGTNFVANWYPAPRPRGLEHIDTDCFWWIDGKQEANYCLFRYAVRSESDRRQDYRIGYWRGWSTARPDHTLRSVTLRLRTDEGGELSTLTRPPPGGAMPCDATELPLLEASLSVTRPPSCPARFVIDNLGTLTLRSRWSGERHDFRPVYTHGAIEWFFESDEGYRLEVTLEHDVE